MADTKIRPGGFVLRVFLGRWFMMFASFLIMAGAGATYLFGVYSKDIKSVLRYDQSTLNLLGSCKDLGANVGVLSGLLAEVTPPWFVLLVGSALNFVGYFFIWAAVTEKYFSKPAVWQMCMYIFIGANSQNFANTGSLVTCVKNFPASRGMMLGLMKGFVGLSGAIFTQLYYAIYGDDSKSMILLIAWLPAVISILFVANIRPMKISRHPNEQKVFYQYLYISLILACLLMGITIAEKYWTFSHGAYVAGVVGVCFLLFLPCFIAFREEYATLKMKEEGKYPPAVNNVVDVEKEVVVPVSTSQKEPEREPSCYGGICNPPKRGEDYGILQALISWDMLILFITTFCGLGCSLTAVDNLGQIGESLGYPTKTVGTFVSLVSIWNYFGRVFAGFVSEVFLRWRFPRTLMMTIALIIPVFGDLLIAFNPFPGAVYLASLLIGFSFGAQLTLLFIIISELFGLKYYSTLFSCGQLASPLGSYILNVKIVGKLYDQEAMKQLRKGSATATGKGLTCIGRECFRLSFIVLACVNIFGALVSLILVIRTRDYYRGDIYKKFRDEMEANEAKAITAKQNDDRGKANN